MTAELVAKREPHEHHYPPASERPWHFCYPPEEIDEIPAWDKRIERYQKRDPELKTDTDDFRKYLKLLRETQRLQPLSAEEREALCGTFDFDDAEQGRRRETPAGPEDIIG